MEKYIEHRKNSGSFLAWVLIIFGILWMLKQSGWDIHFPNIAEFFSGIGHLFGNLLIIIGIIILSKLF